jgi:putative tryptophan/tyrosine transport system substrate-binding protein
MRRREFITLVAGVAATLPLAARAQEAGRLYRLGFLVPVARKSAAVDAMFDEFRRSGFVEGQNLAVIGSFGVTSEQIADAVSAVVTAAPDAIVAGPELYTRALQAATRTIPLISISEDLVSEGLVVSLAKPGGNITGISLLSPELDDKRQDILVDAVPGIRRMAALADLSITQKRHLQQQQEVARSRGVELSIFSYAKADDIAPALDEAKAWGAEAVNFLASPMQLISRGLIFDRMMALRLPAIYQWPDMAEEGGLMGYGTRLDMIYRQTARLLVKAFLGVKPADIPVEQPTSFELVINLKNAKAINFTVPPTLLARADEVIE